VTIKAKLYDLLVFKEVQSNTPGILAKLYFCLGDFPQDQFK
jgi:hypothetical protein